MLTLPRNLAALAKLAPTDSPRYAMNAVRVQPLGGAYRVEVTDGRRLAIVRGNGGPADGAPGPAFLIPPDGWAKALKIGPKREQTVLLETTATNWTARCLLSGDQMTGQLVQGKFPPVDNVLHSANNHQVQVTIRVDPKLLAELLLAAAALDCKAVDLLCYGHEQMLGLVGRNDQGQYLDALLTTLKGV